MTIPQIDLSAQYGELKSEIDAATARVYESGWYILGREVGAFEADFAGYCNVAGCVGVNSGTDALLLALRACGIGPGDEVITVAHTAVATAAAIRLAGAAPVFVDIDPATYTLDPAALEAAITPRIKAVIPVHLYGQPADMDPILATAQARGLRVIEDCAQAHGASYGGRPMGSMGDLACFSFYPTKNLGAMGDGGAVVGRDEALLERVRMLREYGWTPQARYVSQIDGLNSRLDELQAAILRVKLARLDEWNERRRALAAHYDAGLAARLADRVIPPSERPGSHHVYHLYVVRLALGFDRDRVRQALADAGVGAGVHYPVPIHRQPAYRDAYPDLRLPETERAAGEILSLPMHPHLTLADADRVMDALEAALA